MLVPDFGQPIRNSGTLAARQDMLRIFGGIQRESAAHVEELLALGCLDRRLQRLPEQAARLADDAAILADLTEAEVGQFRGALPKLAEMCLALGACGVPETLVHGDLHLGNVALRDGKYLFFDWTDACITHPFFDLLSIFDDEDRTEEAVLRDEYLRVWEGSTSRELLLEAWALAQPLSDLHQAISYQHILNGLEPLARGDFRNVLPLYIRKILKALTPEPQNHGTLEPLV
jgi:thiamine kinase-like enzyme